MIIAANNLLYVCNASGRLDVIDPVMKQRTAWVDVAGSFVSAYLDEADNIIWWQGLANIFPVDISQDPPKVGEAIAL